MRFHELELSLIAIVFLALASIACGGSSGSIGFDITVQAENVVIDGLPQYICPTSTPIATHTPVATAIQPPIYIPASGYVTYTPAADCVWNGFICASQTPFPRFL